MENRKWYRIGGFDLLTAPESAENWRTGNFRAADMADTVFVVGSETIPATSCQGRAIVRDLEGLAIAPR